MALAQGIITTKFAPAERLPASVVKVQAQRILEISPLLRQVLDTVPDVLLVLNSARQVVYANRPMLELYGKVEIPVIGLRPGEVLGCSHAFEESGCGTAEGCRTCGAMAAFLTSRATGQSVEEEFRVTRRQEGDALDLRVRATPLELGNEQFTIFVLTDVSDEKRRRALERIFFHDILNTATAMRASAELLDRLRSDSTAELTGMMRQLVDRLIEEIVAQRQLVQAENGELYVDPAPVNGGDIVREIAQVYSQPNLARECRVHIDVSSQDLAFISDATLVRRVAGNMVKNALEASQPGQVITIGCARRDAGIEFWVHNPAVMPRMVQLQVFQRSFSTKGAGRGLGTYSMKLIGERYLKGRVCFTSSSEEGTIFRVWYPARLARG